MEKINDKLILRKCSWCESWIDEESKAIAETRDKAEWIISHSICEPCAETVMECEKLDFLDDLTVENADEETH